MQKVSIFVCNSVNVVLHPPAPQREGEREKGRKGERERGRGEKERACGRMRARERARQRGRETGRAGATERSRLIQHVHGNEDGALEVLSVELRCCTSGFIGVLGRNVELEEACGVRCRLLRHLMRCKPRELRETSNNCNHIRRFSVFAWLRFLVSN